MPVNKLMSGRLFCWGTAARGRDRHGACHPRILDAEVKLGLAQHVARNQSAPESVGDGLGAFLVPLTVASEIERLQIELFHRIDRAFRWSFALVYNRRHVSNLIDEGVHGREFDAFDILVFGQKQKFPRVV